MKLYFILILIFGLASAKVLADDTEIYVGSESDIPPNIVFIFDTSGSMDRWAAGGKRIDLVKRAAIDTIRDLEGVNLALMRYNPYRNYYTGGQDQQYRGGFLNTPMLDVDDPANKSLLINTINSYPASGGTPLTEAVHEALRFIRGDAVDYGKTKRHWNHSWSYLSHSSTHRNGTYISPISEMCQKNHVVLFTDGASSVDGESNGQIRQLLQTLPAADRPAELTTNCASSSGGDDPNRTESCLEELAYYMYNSDHSADFEGQQSVTLHTIGGFIDGGAQTILNRAAYHGGKGTSASASNYQELKDALTKIFDSISDSSGSFAAPSLSVSTFNSLQQLDHLYYAQFKPAENASWKGNLKRYRLGAGTVVLGADGQPILDPTTQQVKGDAVSYWTLPADAPDGDDVTAGGMASRLTLNRNIYTNIAGNDLTNPGNRISESNSSLTPAVFGTGLRGSEFTDLVRWARGVDVANSTNGDVPRKEIEDPLHTNPTVVSYGMGTDSEPDSTIFLGTNSGYLHAFDTNKDNPKERFAFVPKELLPNIDKYYRGIGLKEYGLDGPISVWHQDANANRIVDNNGSEQAILYVGMRRGGSSYYALDITDRDAPQLLWQINGQSHPNTTTGFEQLGQTWSKMIPAKVAWQGNSRDVLIFGGGYDPAEDDNQVRTPHSMGNAIYMVDAKTGGLLWSASGAAGADLRLTEMTSSIVGDIVAVDDSGDGHVDLLYAADVGGRIWRIDFDGSQTNAANYARGGVIADLGTDGSRKENVRFYTTPDVVYTDTAKVFAKDSAGNLVAKDNKGRYQIAIGSGFRAHPLNEDALDRFYVINDFNVDGAPSVYTRVVRSDLANYGNYDGAPEAKRLNGLYLDLIDQSKGEKVLNKSLTIGDNIFFNTYRPTDVNSRSACEPDIGNGRSYVISPDLKLTTTDLVPGMPPPVQTVIPPTPPPCTGTNCGGCTGPNCKDDEPIVDTITDKTGGGGIDGIDTVNKVYWLENE